VDSEKGRHRVRHAAVLILSCVPLMCGCASSTTEVRRVTSPDGRVDAILLESDCGAPCDPLYGVNLAPKGIDGGEKVAWLDAALVNKQTWGANLKWLGSDRLSIEYLRADHTKLLKQRVDIAGDSITVSLRAGVDDRQATPAATSSKMLDPDRK